MPTERHRYSFILDEQLKEEIESIQKQYHFRYEFHALDLIVRTGLQQIKEHPEVVEEYKRREQKNDQ